MASLRGLCPSLFLLSLLVLPGGAADASHSGLRPVSPTLGHATTLERQLEVTQSLFSEVLPIWEGIRAKAKWIPPLHTLLWTGTQQCSLCPTDTQRPRRGEG